MAKSPRIQALDVIRGLSILGILAVNADGYAAPISASLNPSMWPYPNVGSTAIAYWVMDAFFHDKFVTLFSMLFGISLFLVGGERTDKKKERVLLRRLGALLLFAMLHGFGIWWGDILSLYACTGLIMMFCRSWRPRMLMIVGVVLYTAMAARPLVASASSMRANAANVQAYPRATSSTTIKVTSRKEAIAATTQEARGSWEGAYHVNTRTYLHQLSGDLRQIPATLGLMMIGLSLFKSGFLSAKASSQRYRIVVVVGAFALVAVCRLLWLKDIQMRPMPGDKSIELLLAPVVSMLYASGLILILRTGGQRFLSPLASAGRMAFTNYLSQSIIMTSIFYGGRGGLMGQVNRGPLWGIVITIWVLQLIWSPLWLARLDMGPFEWAWRCMTYGKRVPLLKPTSSSSPRTSLAL